MDASQGNVGQPVSTCECGQPLADYHEAFTRGLCAQCHATWATDNAPWLSPGIYATVADLSWDLSYPKDANMAVRVQVTGEVATKLLGATDCGPKAFIVGQVHWLRQLCSEALRLDRE